MGGGKIPSDAAGYPGLGFDPTPGNLPAVRALVDQSFDAHRRLASVSQTLRSITRGGEEWSGIAADAFSMRVKDLPKLVESATQSFYDCGFQLNEWSAKLESMKSRASDMEARAVTARSRQRDAEGNPDLGLAGQTFETDEELHSAEQRLNKAVKELDSARDALNSLIEDAGRLRHQHDEAAEKVAEAIRRASEEAPDEPGWLDRIGDAIESLAEAQAALANQAWDWVKNHANAIAAVGDVLSTVSAVVGAVGVGLAAVGMVFPPSEVILAPVGGALELTSSGFAAGAFVLHGTARMAGGEDVVSNRTLAQDGLGMIPLGAATRVGGKLGTAMLKSRAADGAANFGLVDSWAGLFGDPSVFENFKPKDRRQAIEMGGVPGGGGPLLIGLENAWKKGSAKDRAADGE
ncbi:putative T7SS-secreted protein [Streptomyces sp. NPDC048644]|uniref:putative T7SS-secreted protein n=1 Tax=Streptomyces sp. NPDC048644 TaxID=3365582 RepID=UPI0037185441